MNPKIKHISGNKHEFSANHLPFRINILPPDSVFLEGTANVTNSNCKMSHQIQMLIVLYRIDMT